MEIYYAGGLILLTAVLAVWSRTRKPAWRLERLKQAIDDLIKNRKHSKRQAAHRMRQLYILINHALNAKDEVLLYQAIDLLKLAAGTGLLQTGEPLRLMTVTIGAIRAKQTDVASNLLDVFRFLLRRWDAAALPQVLHPLILILSVTIKEKNNFLAARVVDIVLTVMERPDCRVDRGAMQASFRAVRMAGLMAIRRGDEALFRELASRLSQWSAGDLTADTATDIVQCLYSWLHRIVYHDSLVMWQVMDELTPALTANGVLGGAALHGLLEGWSQLAGNACLNPNSQVGPAVISRITAMAMESGDALLFRQTMRRLTQIISLALTRFTLGETFLMIVPLANAGRKLLQAELAFGPSLADEFRPQALRGLLAELALAFEILARQQLTVSAEECIAEFSSHWREHPATADRYGKSARKFCDLLTSFCLQRGKPKGRQTRIAGLSNLLAAFSSADRDKLRCIL